MEVQRRTIEADDEMLAERAGHAYCAYVVGKGKTEVIVVLPDGIVGVVDRDAEAVGK
ncbi:hypothetical protein SCLCIDRAFT_1222605 [Scleroderma citrinum Foug A]|uniref:Uncharacterized protein n=1 Tax=Scleroderma citrinum Foug A TaxID=1036808 RepID=A0A0C2YVJ3_9AGAM|nr:hypothetical protein SCLCIDRAFT_1222605 [Scleroderma citrinum Foug A]